MSEFKNLFQAIGDVSYEDRLMEQADISEEELQYTVENTKNKLFLRKGERILHHEFTIYSEPRAISEYIRGSSGIRLTKGVYLGGSRGRSESHQEVRMLDYGTLTITNKRLIFSGKCKTQDIPIGRINILTPFTDALQVNVSNRQRPFYFSAKMGLLPYLAIKDLKMYSKFSEISNIGARYVAFITELGPKLSIIETQGTQTSAVQAKYIKKVNLLVKNLENEFSKIRSSKVPKTNKEILLLISKLKSFLAAYVFVRTEADILAKEVKHPKGLFGFLTPSEANQIDALFKKKHNLTPSEYVQREADKLASQIEKIGSKGGDEFEPLFDRLVDEYKKRA